MLTRFIKKNIDYYLSKNEYYDSVTTENGFLNKIASSIFVESENVLKTNQRILFNNKVDINSPMSQVVAKLGKYNYYLEKSRTQNHSILFYKKLIGSLRSRFELHFIEDQLIIGFATFDVSNTYNKLKVLKALAEKYNFKMEDIDLENFRLEDEYNNYIQIIDSVNITLAYGNKSKTNNQLIYDITREKEHIKQSLINRENLHLQNNI